MEASADSRGRTRSRSPRKHSKHSSSHHHRRHRSSSRSRSRSKSTSSSRSSSHHKHKHHKHHHSDHHKHRKHHHRDKDKHHKHRHRRSSSSSSSSSSVSEKGTSLPLNTATQSTNIIAAPTSGKEFGARGILRQYDMHKKQREFEAWLSDIKHLPNFHGTKSEMLDYWKEYAEDYNTVTLPHEKYYDLDIYENLVATKQIQDTAYLNTMNTGSINLLNDAEQRKFEKQKLLKQQELQQIAIYRNSMNSTTMESMRRQQELQQQMEYAFRAGNIKEVDRIKRLLEPDK